MAGLNRLGHKDVGTPLDEALFLPASGQGAIAVECRSDDAATIALLAAIDHAPSRHAVLAERALLAALGGNCHSALAVLTRPEGARIHMTAALFSPDGAERSRARCISPPATMMASPRWPATCWPARLPKSPSISTESDLDRAAADPAPSARQCGQLCRRRTAGRGAGGDPLFAIEPMAWQPPTRPRSTPC
jgi:hypothetical protein